MTKKYLLNDKYKNKVLSEIKKYQKVLLFLDYDGTLAPFKSDPAKAFPFPGSIDLLRKIEEKNNYYISLISGRSLSDLEKMVDFPEINYAGNHGLEIKLANGENFNCLDKKEIDYSSYDRAKKIIKEEYRAKKGFRMEDKGAGFALHLSVDDEQQAEIKKQVKQLINDKYFEVLSGRKVIEVRPVGWDKGKAVQLICKHIIRQDPVENYLPIYMGDDSTDEDVFKILNHGIGIYIKNEGKIVTKADYYLNNPADVFLFLNNILTY